MPQILAIFTLFHWMIASVDSDICEAKKRGLWSKEKWYLLSTSIYMESIFDEFYFVPLVNIRIQWISKLWLALQLYF